MNHRFLGSLWRSRLLLVLLLIGLGLPTLPGVPGMFKSLSILPLQAATSPSFSLGTQDKIVMLGDSITKNASQQGGYVWLLQEYLKRLYPEETREIINAGISGNKSTDMQERFQTDVLNARPDVVMINVGVNDVWHSFTKVGENAGVPLNRYRDNVAEMVKAAQAQGITVVLLSPTVIYENLNGPENQRLASYVGAMREIAVEYGCHFVDLNMPFRHVISTYQRYAGQAENILTRDGVHLNLAGNQIMAYTILRQLGVPEGEIQSLKVGN